MPQNLSSRTVPQNPHPQRHLFVGLLSFAVLMCGALFAGPLAFAAPSYLILTADREAPGGAELAQQLAKWRQMGLAADAQLIQNENLAEPGFEYLGILEFPSEASGQRWRDVAEASLGEGVVVTPVDAVAHMEKTPRNSAKSIFMITQYRVRVPEAGFRDYVENYQMPHMHARIDRRIVNRYTNFYAKPGSGAPWQSLLVLEYRDPHSFSISGQIQQEINETLSESNDRYSQLHKEQQDIRTETASARSRWVELPPPDLGDLPSYQPQEKLKGSLRILGSELKNSVDLLAEGFTHFHPDVKVSTSHIPSSEGGIAGLYMGVSDVAPMGDDAKITDLMPYYNTFGYLPTEISVATGGYEKRGSLFAWAIAVNKNNPIDHISLDQLKRLFGGTRTGGWEIYEHNYKFTSAHALRREDLIRTWDQLGLDGEYAGKEIETFGYAAPGFSIAIERSWFHWSKKWNPNFREYVETKQTVPDEDGFAVASERALEDLQSNKFAMGIVALMHAKHYPKVKILAVSKSDESEPVALTPENVATRRYPLIRDAYFYVNKAPGKPLNRIVREFMRYCLSREGQESIVRAGYYYPLSLNYLLEQREKLD